MLRKLGVEDAHKNTGNDAYKHPEVQGTKKGIALSCGRRQNGSPSCRGTSETAGILWKIQAAVTATSPLVFCGSVTFTTRYVICLPGARKN